MVLVVNRKEFDNVKSDVRVQCEKVKAKLEKKNARKVKWLEDGILKKEEIEKYGKCRIFTKGECKCENEPGEVMVVGSQDEVIEVSKDERNLLSLDPKFCVTGRLDEESCEVAVEECIAKLS